jgi:hypothetical protein
VRLSPRLSLRRPQTGPPELAGARSPDRRSERSGKNYEEDRRWSRGSFPFSKSRRQAASRMSQSRKSLTLTEQVSSVRRDSRGPAIPGSSCVRGPTPRRRPTPESSPRRSARRAVRSVHGDARPRPSTCATRGLIPTSLRRSYPRRNPPEKCPPRLRPH